MYHAQSPNPCIVPPFIPLAQQFTHPVSQPSASLSHILEAGPTTPQSTQDMYDPSGAYYSPATTTFGPGNDGFEAELQFYLDGEQAWPGTNALFSLYDTA